jgi:DDE superfamily endonuclease
VRQIRRMPARAVLLFEDETILRLLPELRRAWSLRGQQARVPISGKNAKCVLFGALNPRTGHRLVARAPSLRQEYFQEFLRLLRRSYPGQPLWLLLDRASAHTAPASQALAATLGIVLLWLPKQCSELNGMDQLWRELKANISANHQFKDIEQHACLAQTWLLSLSRTEILRKAGVFSQNFWLQEFLQ